MREYFYIKSLYKYEKSKDHNGFKDGFLTSDKILNFYAKGKNITTLKATASQYKILLNSLWPVLPINSLTSCLQSKVHFVQFPLVKLIYYNVAQNFHHFILKMIQQHPSMKLLYWSFFPTLLFFFLPKSALP